MVFRGDNENTYKHAAVWDEGVAAAPNVGDGLEESGSKLVAEAKCVDGRNDFFPF